MEAVAQSLNALIQQIAPLLHQIQEKEAAVKPAPGKWSKKEILGHLIDSACNNQQKFVRSLISDLPVDFAGYDQDEWVYHQHYQERAWADLVTLWAAYNRHLAHIIQSTPPSKLDNTIRISDKGPYSLRFMMPDYVEHLKHHLKQILPEQGLSSNFSMEPYV